MGLFKRKTEEPPRRQPNLMAGQDSYTFRRSRTLTGSASSEVKAAVESRSDLKSERIKLHELKRHRRGVGSALFMSLAVVIGLGWLLSQYIRVPSNVVYQRSAELQQQPDSSRYVATIESYFSANPLQRFYFRLDQAALNSYVGLKHPEIKALELRDRLPGFYEASIALRQPLLSWTADDKKVYVDRSGVSFSTNYYAPPSVTVDDRSGIKLEQGSNMLASTRFISFIGQVVGKVNSTETMQVNKVIIPSGVTRQVQLQVKGGEYPIKASIDRNPAAQAGDIVNAVKYVQQKKIKPEYLDVRVAGRAFYR